MTIAPSLRPQPPRPRSPAGAGLARTAARGVAATLVQFVGTRLVGFLAQLVLAKLLAPAQFGQIGLVLSTNALVAPIMEFGIEDVIMSRRKSLHLWLTPAYGLSITLAVIAGLVLAAAAPVAAVLYRDPSLTGLLLIMAVSAGVYGFSVMPDARLRADLRFGVTSNYALAETIGLQGAALVLAWLGWGAYAFVAPVLACSLTRAIVFRRLAPVSLRGAFRPRRWRYLLGRGSLVFGQRFFQILREQGDYCMLGLMTAPAVVGAYFFAFRLAAQPVYVLVRSLNVVLFPTLSLLAHDPERQVAAALRIARLLSFMVTPFCFLLAATAEPLVMLLFGERWVPSIPILQILGVGLAFDVLPAVAAALATARGLFRLQFRAGAVSSAGFLVVVLVGVWFRGAPGAALGVAATFILSSIIYPVLVFHPMRGGWPARARLLLEPVVLAGLAMGLGVLAAARVPGDLFLARIAITALTGGSTYLVSVWICAPGLARDLAGQLASILQRSKPR